MSDPTLTREVALAIVVEARNKDAIGAMKPQSIFAVDWNYTHPETGKKQHAVKLVKTLSAAEGSRAHMLGFATDTEVTIAEGVIDWKGYIEALEDAVLTLWNGEDMPKRGGITTVVNAAVKAAEKRREKEEVSETTSPG